MRYPFTHRTKRIVFLFVLLPTAALAYITLPRGDVRLPAENVRARTQDIAIAANTPLIPRGRFLDPSPAYVSQSAVVRTPADEAAIEELALTAAATPHDPTAQQPTQYAPNASSSSDVGETPTRGSARSRHAGGGSTAYPLMLARGMEGAAAGVSGNAKPAATSGTGATHTTTTTAAAPVTTTSTALATGVSSTSVATSTVQTATHPTSNAGSATPAARAATPAVAAAGQNAIASTEHPLADSIVAQVASGPAAAAATGSAVHETTSVTSGGAPVTQSVSTAEHPPSPSSTPEPLTLLLTASGLACLYGARRHIR
jgi:hypothetical protein